MCFKVSFFLLALISLISVASQTYAVDENTGSEPHTLADECPYGYRGAAHGVQWLPQYSSACGTSWACSQASKNSDGRSVFSYTAIANCAQQPADASGEEGCYPSDKANTPLGVTCGQDVKECYDSTGASFTVSIEKECTDYCTGPQTDPTYDSDGNVITVTPVDGPTGNAQIHNCSANPGASGEQLAGGQSEMASDLEQCGSGYTMQNGTCTEIPEGCGYVNGDYHCPDGADNDSPGGGVGDGGSGDGSEGGSDGGGTGSGSEDGPDSGSGDGSDGGSDSGSGGSGDGTGGDSGVPPGYVESDCDAFDDGCYCPVGSDQCYQDPDQIDSPPDGYQESDCGPFDPGCYCPVGSEVCYEEVEDRPYEEVETCPFDQPNCQCNEQGVCQAPSDGNYCDNEGCCNSEFYEWNLGQCEYRWDCPLGEADNGYGCEPIPSCSSGDVWNGQACIGNPEDDPEEPPEEQPDEPIPDDPESYSDELQEIIRVLGDIKEGTAKISDLKTAIDAFKEAYGDGNEELIEKLDDISEQLTEQIDLQSETVDVLVGIACALNADIASCPDRTEYESENDVGSVSDSIATGIEGSSVYTTAQSLMDSNISSSSSCNLYYSFEVDLSGHIGTYAIDICEYITPIQNDIRALFLMFWAVVAMFRVFSA
jgi:hypothetical protein